MSTTKQDKKDELERKRVQHVLDYHYEKYGARVKVIDKAINVYPHLRERKRQLHWDWVCRDTETNEEIAIEVKRITDERLEVSYNTIRSLFKEIKNDLLNKLPGTFSLHIGISPKNYYLPLGGQQKKQKFKNVLCEAICQTAQTLKLGDNSRGLVSQISGKLPFAWPASFFCALVKSSDEGSMLQLGSSVGGSWSIELKKHELEKFEELVSYANNEQLKLAKEEFNVKETFLVITVEEGLRQTIPETVAMALEQINPDSYSQIDYIYYVSGEVAEIPLPNH